MATETATPPTASPTTDGAHKRPPRPDEDLIWTLHKDGVCLAETGKPDLAAEAYRKLIAIAPDDLHARHNLGIMLVLSGNMEEAIRHLEIAHGMAPEDEQIRAHLGKAYFGFATHHLMERNYDKVRSGYHRLLAFDPNHVAAKINLLDLLARIPGPATLADFAPELDGRPIGTHVLFAAVPESGSNFIAAALSVLTRWEQNFFAFGYRQNEQELYLPHLLAVAESNTVTEQHCRATETNIQIVQAFGIKPIVVVRNLYDVVVSVADSYDSGAVHNTFFADHWEHLDPARRFDLVIDHVVPWNLAFFVSWITAAEADRADCILVNYEALIADKPGVLKGICDHQGIDTSIAACIAAAARVDGMELQTGVTRDAAGRGHDALSAAQKERIRQFAAYYHDIDFAPIGL